MMSHGIQCHSDVPQCMRNHHCSDGIRCHGERNACSRQGIGYIRGQLVIVIRDRYPYQVADDHTWECMYLAKWDSSTDNVIHLRFQSTE